jgi:hypothetical protein
VSRSSCKFGIAGERMGSLSKDGLVVLKVNRSLLGCSGKWE